MAGTDTDASTTVRALDQLEPDPHARVFDEPGTVLLALDAGADVAPHRHPDATVVIHVIEGVLEVALDGTPHVVEAGEVLRFAGEREVAPEAREPSRALVHLHRGGRGGGEGS